MKVSQSGSASPAHASTAPTVTGTAAMVSVRGRMPSSQILGGFTVVAVSGSLFISELVSKRDEQFPRAPIDLLDVSRRGVEGRIAADKIGLVEQVSRCNGYLPVALPGRKSQ